MLWEYLRSFRGHWFTLMTGALTLPLTVMAFYVDSVSQRIAFAVFAVLCFSIASFRSWEVERAEVNRLRLLASGNKPRLVLGFELMRGYDASANDASFKHEPFFLRNDGYDTALNLEMPSTELGGEPVTFWLASNHVSPGDVVAVHIYRCGHRIDRDIHKTFAELLDVLVRDGANRRVQLVLPVTIKYQDRNVQYSTLFRVTCGAHPRDSGGFQMETVRVELERDEQNLEVGVHRAAN